MAEPEMQLIADLIARTARAVGDDAELANIRTDVATLCAKFAPYDHLG
jgi:glycine/serine hydroxymethyltransferase